MTLLGLSPFAFFVGLGALFAGLLLLQMLRVRLRRARVDSLLFFVEIAEQQRPRSLLGLPRRWLSFLLALLALFLLWFRYADPALEAKGPSRIVLVDAAQAPQGKEARAAYWRKVREGLESKGLGPRGAVYAVQGQCSLLLAPKEAPSLLERRAAELPLGGQRSGLYEALQMAAERLRAGDQILWMGPGIELPHTWQGLPLLQLPTPEPAELGCESILLDPSGDWVLRVWSSSGQVVADFDDGRPRHLEAKDGRIVLGAQLPERIVLRDPLSKIQRVLQLPLRAKPPLRVFLSPKAPEIFRDLILSDPGLILAENAAADVVVGQAGPAQAPRLRVLDGTATQSPVQARVLADLPLPILLSKLRSDQGRCLDPLQEEAPRPGISRTQARDWVVDASSGRALVRMVTGENAPELQLASWLLDFEDDRDLPLLLGFALRVLGGQRLPALQPAGSPLKLAVREAGVLRFHSQDGRELSFASTGPSCSVRLPEGVWQLDGERIVSYPAAAPLPAAAAAPSKSPQLASFAERSPLPWLLLLGAAILLGVDMLLYHRARLP
ncbi:MAG: hypothetical protein CSA62_00250 [Planctomycetota bacterium]|nr:MAG: hypothetical protein CSA62_00250 [Planctomycetota bacterium]